MNPKTLQIFRQKLEQQRVELLAIRRSQEDAVKTVELDQSRMGRLSEFFSPALRLLSATLCLLASASLPADDIHVAAASNFRPAMRVLARQFEARSGHRVILVFGSTGKQYAQIVNNAPFDAFFAADVARPLQLEQDGLAVARSRFTYALGKLVLWSPKPGVVDPEGKVLETGSFRYLSLANPALAPYGLAAQQTLESLQLWTKLEPKLVRGENIGQAYQFISSGNAELGFIAMSQIQNPKRKIKGSYWEVPQDLHSPIEQQAVLLKESDAAKAFLEFTRSWDALKIISGYGYQVP